VPTVSRFYGIIIYFYWQEHAPPHFHAKYNDDEISMEILSGAVIGSFPKRALAMVEMWRKLHQDELMSDWDKAEKRQALDQIEPLV
jgi:hypothetical protein